MPEQPKQECNGVHCKCMGNNCSNHHWADHCHCGKDGHALNSVNCEVHGYTITPKPKQETWRERFYKQFYFRHPNPDKDEWILAPTEVENFISQEIRRSEENIFDILKEKWPSTYQEIRNICRTNP